MTKTQYYDMSIIMRQALILAADKGILAKSPFDDVVINTKMFRSNKKKNDASQVFLIDEQVQIEQEALADFGKNGYPASIAVALCFQMGLRIGEMAVVKWSDIDELQENYMHIQRMEVKRHKHQTNGTWKSTLIDSQLVNLNTIRTLVGHEDERTALKCYCFNRKNDLQPQESLEKALHF